MIRRVAAGLAAILLLSACAMTTGEGTPGTGRADAAKSATAKAPAKTKTPKIGDAYTYEDGLKVEITRVKSAKASQYAAPKGGVAMVVLTVRLTNGTEERMDGALTTVKASYGADGDQAEQVYDSGKGIDSMMTGSILPGKAKSAEFAFAIPVKSRGDVTVEVSPDFTHEAAVFAGSVK